MNEITLGVLMFTVVVLALVGIILVARSYLVNTGDVQINLNGEKDLTLNFKLLFIKKTKSLYHQLVVVVEHVVSVK